MFGSIIRVFFALIIGTAVSLRTQRAITSSPRNFGLVGGQRWGSDFDGFKGSVVLGPITSFQHLGDDMDGGNNDYVDDYDQRRRQNFNANVGKALESLRRELPLVFAVSNLDFSIFANTITVTDGNGNTMPIQKSIYAAAVKSLRMASAISSMYPSMNVKKIDYVEDCRTIQCLVDVVLPDSVRIDGQAVWEGMFYFGINSEGLIESHIFDRKVSNFRPQTPVNTASMPWLRSAPAWSTDLLGGVSRPQGGGMVSACEEEEVPTVDSLETAH